jgi:MFS transporter, SET family, sugar efflux transporter
LVLVTLFDATTAEVGWVLSVYNISGLLASLAVPTYADRRGDYLRPMLACGVLTGALALVLAFAISLPIAVIGLVVLGGPVFFAGIAGVGLPLFQQMITRPGLSTGLYMNTRRLGAIASGPIIAIGSITVFGQRGIFLGCALVTILGLHLLGIAGRTMKRGAAHSVAAIQS